MHIHGCRFYQFCRKRNEKKIRRENIQACQKEFLGEKRVQTNMRYYDDDDDNNGEIPKAGALPKFLPRAIN